MKTKSYPLNISRQIDVNFRNYALYVLENRGIPSFYDGLTNVQRFIVLNAPANYNKTISLVGSCISDGYHHGDKSLIGAINKLARPFGSSEQLLQGDGFFGTPVDGTAAAARYTAIRINPEIADMIKKSSFLNHKNEEESWDPLWLDLPIGITNTIVGIAVGYKTTILPRKLSDVQAFLDGKKKEVHPYFKGFTGKITRYRGMDKTWLIEGKVTINDKERTIRITDLPPMMKYASYLRKLDSIVFNHPGSSIINNSQTNIDLLVNFRGPQETWDNLVIEVDKAAKMLVTETPVFVKDGLVLEYERIEDYINDYRYRLAELSVKRLTHFRNETNEELEFQICKEKYLKFMIEGKRGVMKSDEEINLYLTEITQKSAIGDTIKRRLNAILLRSLSENELRRTQELIQKYTTELQELQEQLAQAIIKFEGMTDTSIERATQNRTTSTVNLFEEEIEEIDGIEVFDNKLHNENDNENDDEND